MAGGVSINLISGFLLIPWGLQINLSYYWGHYITMTAIIPFFIVLHIGIPMEIADRGNDGYDLLKAAKVEGQLPNIHFFGEIELVRNLMKTVNQIANERELCYQEESKRVPAYRQIGVRQNI